MFEIKKRKRKRKRKRKGQRRSMKKKKKKKRKRKRKISRRMRSKKRNPGPKSSTILCFSGWGIGVWTSGRVWKRGTRWTLDSGEHMYELCFGSFLGL